MRWSDFSWPLIKEQRPTVHQPFSSERSTTTPTALLLVPAVAHTPRPPLSLRPTHRSRSFRHGSRLGTRRRVCARQSLGVSRPRLGVRRLGQLYAAQDRSHHECLVPCAHRKPGELDMVASRIISAAPAVATRAPAISGGVGRASHLGVAARLRSPTSNITPDNHPRRHPRSVLPNRVAIIPLHLQP